jgi:hypothetical protein
MTFEVVDDDTVVPVYPAATNLLKDGGFEHGGGIWTQGWWGVSWFSPEAAEQGNFGRTSGTTTAASISGWTVDESTTYTLSVRARKDGDVTGP